MDEVVGDGQFFGSSWESDPTVAIINGSLKLQNMSVEADVLLGLPVYRVTGNLPDNLAAENMVLWVGVDDLFVRQIRLDGVVDASEYEGLVPQGLVEVFQTGLIRLSRFNEPIEISASELPQSPTPLR